MSVLAALLIGAGMFPTSVQTPITEVIVAPEPGTAEYGAYLAASLGCADCHGADMTGIAPSGFGPAGPNLTAIVPKWSEAEFFTLFREGKDPSGRLIDPLVMPWKSYNHALVDEDLKSIYLYMNSLEYVEMSER